MTKRINEIESHYWIRRIITWRAYSEYNVYISYFYNFNIFIRLTGINL